jgi:hypothetical protein
MKTRASGIIIRPNRKIKNLIIIAFPVVGVNLHPKGFSDIVWIQCPTGSPHDQHQK